MSNRRQALLPFMILMSTLLLGCTGSSGQESTGEYVDDAVITARVKTAFVADKSVSALDIRVTTYKRVVQLSGFANTQQEIDRAVALARDVPGVQSVKNDIRRTPQSAGEYLDDSVITARVKTAFAVDKSVDAPSIKVETFEGVVRLSGSTDSQQKIDRATELAREVRGVQSVENNIQLEKPEN